MLSERKGRQKTKENLHSATKPKQGDKGTGSICFGLFVVRNSYHERDLGKQRIRGPCICSHLVN